MQELMLFGKFASYHFRTGFSISHSRQSVALDAMSDQVFHYRFCSSLRQSLIVGIIASVVAVRTQLDGDIGVLVEHDYQFVECLGRCVGQCGFVELIEDIVDQHRDVDWRQRELQGAVDTLVGVPRKADFLFDVQVAFACAKQHVIHSRFDDLSERTVHFHAQFQVRSVVAHHIDQGFGQFVSVFLIHPSRDGLHDFGVLEGIDVIPTFAVVTVAAEEATVIHAFKGHTEVIAHRVHRRPEVFNRPPASAVAFSLEKIQSAHARMTIGREVELTVWTERREHLVARCVDRATDIFHSSEPVAHYSGAPDIQSTLASRHIAHKIEPFAIRRYGRMCIGRQGVACDLAFCRLAPTGVAAF